MIPITLFSGRRVAVLGLGRTGLTAARALRAGGAEVLCLDDQEPGRAAAVAEGFEAAPGDVPLPDGIAALIASPGIPHLYPTPHPAIASAWAQGIPVDNDVGLFFAACPDGVDCIAVTGSNGKSTTAALIHHCLVETGRRVQLGGNIGRGILDLDPPQSGEAVVLELSSYQTDLARTLKPTVAVLTNLAPDHLDRHGGLGGYFAAKRRLFEVTPPRVGVIGIDEPEGLALTNALIGQVRPVLTIGPAERMPTVALEPQAVVVRGERLALDDAPSLRGRHNMQNAAAALLVAETLGAPREGILAAFRSFPGLRHRSQRVGERAGVLFVNDSKATNADAAEKAILAYDRVRWIVGGRQKEGGIESLRPHFGRIAKAYLIGEATEQFATSLRTYPHEVPYEKCGDLATAVARAAAEAEPGETVLLAPACASFDQFPSFEKRGEAFEEAVRNVVNSIA